MRSAPILCLLRSEIQGQDTWKKVMSAQLDIREAGVRDAAVISELNTDVQRIHAAEHPWRFKEPGPDSFTETDAAEFIGRPNRFSFVAFVNNEPKGYVVAEIREMPETSRVFEHAMVYVHHLSVRPDSQGHGIGKALLDAVKQRGDATGISLLALDTWTFNEKALRFFQRYGLVPYNIRLWNKVH